MKIQCSVCEASEAKVVCCADEAALCWACDEKVHAANKLAGKHQRVSLSDTTSQMPTCDICQEMVGYFFCLEDRALLCRKCDLAIHTANEFASSHQRFLLTGAKVGLQPLDSGSSFGKSQSGINKSNISTTNSCSESTRGNPLMVGGEYNEVLPSDIGDVGGFGQSKLSFAGESAPGSNAPWHLDELFGSTELGQNYDNLNNGKSKGNGGRLGDSLISPDDDELDMDDCFGLVPETCWTVPQVPSPPIGLGPYWPKKSCFSLDGTVFVPDSPLQNPNGVVKRQRRF